VFGGKINDGSGQVLMAERTVSTVDPASFKGIPPLTAPNIASTGNMTHLDDTLTGIHFPS
jgi:hypothetical protein